MFLSSYSALPPKCRGVLPLSPQPLPRAIVFKVDEEWTGDTLEVGSDVDREWGSGTRGQGRDRKEELWGW